MGQRQSSFSSCGRSLARARVVVTGMGLWTSLGRGVDRNWHGFVTGECGVGPIRYWDPSQYATKVAATVETGSPAEDRPGRLRQGFLLYEEVVGEALRDAGFYEDTYVSEIGLATGTSVNHLDWRRLPEMVDFCYSDRPALDLGAYVRQCDPGPTVFSDSQGDLINRVCARRYGLGGPSFIADTACSASAHAIGEAFRMVRRGGAQAMIAGGAAALVRPTHILAFERLRALSPNPDPATSSRPFDRDRDGFVMGEGAGAILLESLESAQRRGARIYGEIAGYGTTLSGYTMTDPSPDGEAEGRAMALALADADAAPEEIGYVAAHGTSTPKGDSTETQAIRRVFGRHADRLLVSSNKGHIGHTISSAGVCNLIASLKAIETGWVPPTANLDRPDPECDLDYVPKQARRAEIGAALSNSFAFGGQNAALVVRRFAV